MKSDGLIEDYCFDVTDNQTKAVYPKADVDAAIDELKDELNRAKVREDVLVTDNRNLLDKVKKLENLLRENAEHYKRNEAQILENSDKVIAELKALNHDLCERVTENDEIRLHWEEIKQTRSENERMKARIAELEEERRWRKFSEEKPEKGQKVLFCAKYKTDKVREWIGDFRHVDGMKENFSVFYASAPGWGCEFLVDEVFGWMPLPSAPKEER